VEGQTIARGDNKAITLLKMAGRRTASPYYRRRLFPLRAAGIIDHDIPLMLLPLDTTGRGISIDFGIKPFIMKANYELCLSGRNCIFVPYSK
jgi:hypothetical protein